MKFFYWRLRGLPIADNKVVWSAFWEAKTFRNKLAHPSQGKISYSSHTVRAANAHLIAVFEVAKMIGWSTEEYTGE